MIKLKVTAEPTLTLGKERRTLRAGEVFEVDAERAGEIMSATYKGKKVVELDENDTPAQEPGKAETKRSVEGKQPEKSKNKITAQVTEPDDRG
ncbi:MAG: hypothetical protein FWG40_01165 [Peptococcaceae bacterium]|nr:hypothetical protein [Peptococcaceae bacterium]